MHSSWPEVDEAVQEGIDTGMYPGGTLVIGQGDQILYAKAYGHETFSPDSPAVNLDTIYDMASVSKVVGTATASWLLMEDGLLDPERRVSDYLPDFQASGKQDVKVRDLMTHVSGLKAYENYRVAEKKRRVGESHADALLRHYMELEPSYKSGERYVYSCLNFQTLARLNETVAGKRQEDLLTERVYTPLGMNDTRYILNDEQLARVAPTFKDEEGNDVRGTVHDPLARYHGSWKNCPGNAGVFSTAKDMAIYCQMILNEGKYSGHRFFAPSTIRRTTDNQLPLHIGELRGFGWDIYEMEPYITPVNRESGKEIIGHSGYTGTLLLLDKNTKTYMVFLTNRTYPTEEGATDQNPSIQEIRKSIWSEVLRSRREYANHFDPFATPDDYYGQPASD